MVDVKHMADHAGARRVKLFRVPWRPARVAEEVGAPLGSRSRAAPFPPRAAAAAAANATPSSAVAAATFALPLPRALPPSVPIPSPLPPSASFCCVVAPPCDRARLGGGAGGRRRLFGAFRWLRVRWLAALYRRRRGGGRAQRAERRRRVSATTLGEVAPAAVESREEEKE
ncbi:hypothetical protein DAI22_07g131400 [Oryza sativa Japonica Group]|nr:hypothetical protein DAI22_07g131400 [Oryza sativa Japonica Group]